MTEIIFHALVSASVLAFTFGLSSGLCLSRMSLATMRGER